MDLTDMESNGGYHQTDPQRRRMEPVPASKLHLILQRAPEGALTHQEMGQDAINGQAKIEQAHLDRQGHCGNELGNDTSIKMIQDAGGDEPGERADADSIDIDGKPDAPKATGARSNVCNSINMELLDQYDLHVANGSTDAENEATSDGEDGLTSTMTVSQPTITMCTNGRTRMQAKQCAALAKASASGISSTTTTKATKGTTGGASGAPGGDDDDEGKKPPPGGDSGRPTARATESEDEEEPKKLQVEMERIKKRMSKRKAKPVPTQDPPPPSDASSATESMASSNDDAEPSGNDDAEPSGNDEPSDDPEPSSDDSINSNDSRGTRR